MTDLSNAVDVHVHAGPSLFDRKFDAIELAEAYADAGVGGFVLKSHCENTMKSARLASARVDDVEVHSAIALNAFVGGFNPAAVKYAIDTGARVVWLPTLSAANFDPAVIGRHLDYPDMSLSPLTDGELRSDVRDVLGVIGDADAHVALGNGHLSRRESVAVLDGIEEMGLSMPYLITHADFDFMGLSIDDQERLAERGAVIEKCYLPLQRGDVSLETVVDSIRSIGPDRCVLSTDHGQAENESPPVAYRAYVERLGDAGVDEGELEALATTTPRRLLGLETAS